MDYSVVPIIPFMFLINYLEHSTFRLHRNMELRQYHGWLCWLDWSFMYAVYSNGIIWWISYLHSQLRDISGDWHLWYSTITLIMHLDWLIIIPIGDSLPMRIDLRCIITTSRGGIYIIWWDHSQYSYIFT